VSAPAPGAFEYWYDAALLRVVDGDTVDVVLDLGFRIAWTVRLRLYGINAYELTSSDPALRQKALAGKAFVEANLAGRRLVIQTHLDRQEKFGRWLGTVWAFDGAASTWLNVNDALVAAGLAVPYMV